MVVFYIQALQLLDESEEDEGETEEPEDSTREQAEFDWAHTWMEDWGASVLAEDKTQGLLAQVFGLFRPHSSLYSVLVFHFSILASDHI